MLKKDYLDVAWYHRQLLNKIFDFSSSLSHRSNTMDTLILAGQRMAVCILDRCSLTY